MTLPVKPGPNDDLYLWATYYAAHGICVIPMRPDTKRPMTKHLNAQGVEVWTWKEYQTTAPSDAQLRIWFEGKTAKDLGIAAVLGPVSGYLAACDYDHEGIVTFLLEESQPLLRATWTQRTGSGKLHLFVRTLVDHPGSSIKWNGETVVDTKASGGYVVLEPSIHPSGGRYQALYGDPTTCAEVPDARAVSQRIYHGWRRVVEARNPAPVLQTTPSLTSWTVPPPPPTTNGHVADLIIPANGQAPMTNGAAVPAMPNLGMRILPPCTGAERDRLYNLVLTHPLHKIRRLILQDEAPEEDRGQDWKIDWGDVITERPGHWHSEVHMSAHRHIHDRLKVDLETSELIFATFPVGDLCYRDRSRPHHGFSLLWYEWFYKLEVSERTQASPEDLHGLNFLCQSPRIADFGEEVFFICEVTNPIAGRTRTLQLKRPELYSRRTFSGIVSEKLHMWAQLQEKYDSPAGWVQFLKKFYALAEETDVPESIKARGLIKHTIASYAAVEVRYERPLYPSHAPVAWVDREQVFLRAGEVMGYLNGVMRSAPKQSSVWTTLVQIGARRQEYVYQDGTGEEVWVLPKDSLLPGIGGG